MSCVIIVIKIKLYEFAYELWYNIYQCCIALETVTFQQYRFVYNFEYIHRAFELLLASIITKYIPNNMRFEITAVTINKQT